MTAEKIIEQINKDTDIEINKIISNAEEQANIIIRNTKKEAEQDVNKILSEGKQQSENIKKIHISKANQDIKREIMNAREDVIEQCFRKAHHELSILKGKNYEKIVKKLVKDGMKKLGGKCSLLISRAADKTIAEELGLEPDTSEETIINDLKNSCKIILKNPEDYNEVNPYECKFYLSSAFRFF